MNHQAHRVIFNKSRGCMMAVSEVAGSEGKSKSASKRRKHRVLRALSFLKLNLGNFDLLNKSLAQSIRAQAATNKIAVACLVGFLTTSFPVSIYANIALNTNGQGPAAASCPAAASAPAGKALTRACAVQH